MICKLILCKSFQNLLNNYCPKMGMVIIKQIHNENFLVTFR